MPITIEVEEIEGTLRNIAKARRRWVRLAKPTVAGQAQKMVRRIKTRRLSGRPGLRARTGALRRAVGAKTIQDSHGITAQIGLLKLGGRTGGKADVLSYGRIHEFGGTIRAKRAKYLTIPLPAAKTSAGVTKFTAKEAKRIYSAGTFVAKGVIFGKLGLTKGGRQRTTTKGTIFGAKSAIVPLFVLKKQVTIPKRPWLRPEVPLFLFAVQKLMERKLADVLAGKR